MILFNNILGFAICIFLTTLLFSFAKRKFISNHFFLYVKNNKALATLLFLTLALLVFTFNLFRVKSNIEYVFKNDGELMIETTEGFKGLQKTKNDILLNEIFRNENVNIQSIKIKRRNESFIHTIENFLNPNKVIIIEFNSKNHYSLTADIKNDLAPINASKALKFSNSNFAINTNFYGENPLGEIIIKKKRFGDTNKNGSGFFKIIDGKPIVGAKSLFSRNLGTVSHSCQAFPSVMKNGIMFPYINSEKAPYKNSWKRKTYRNLLGTLKNGNLICVLSHSGGLLSIKEVAIIAKKYGVTNAALFDGGAALQYEYNSKDFEFKFSALNNTFDFGETIDKNFITLGNCHFPAKSPVFLTIEHLKTKSKQHSSLVLNDLRGF
jgi:exopolysaccharide biosynthesis protein